jgi:hypothetical protein
VLLPFLTLQVEEKRRDLFTLFKNLSKVVFNEALTFVGGLLQSVIAPRGPAAAAGPGGRSSMSVASWQVGPFWGKLLPACTYHHRSRISKHPAKWVDGLLPNVVADSRALESSMLYLVPQTVQVRLYASQLATPCWYPLTHGPPATPCHAGS